MYGMTAKRFDPDLYKKHKGLKERDFILGFAVAGLVWFLFFNPVWYAAPLVVFCLAMLGIKFKFRRRYFIYGALGLVFFPFLIWSAFTVFFYGRNELK